MKNIMLKTQLYSIAGIVMLVTIMLAYTLFSAFEKNQQLNQSLLLIESTNSGMLTLRRNEKDFLARNQLKYQQKFHDNKGKLVFNINQLKQLLDNKTFQTLQRLRSSNNLLINMPQVLTILSRYNKK